MSPAPLIREATPTDWGGIWPFMRAIVAAGETFCWDRDISEEGAREIWFGWGAGGPRVTVVAVGPDGAIWGTAISGRNHGGNASHVASASFMVDPARAGQGVGRALGEHVLGWARSAGFAAMQFNAVVETNTTAVALWRSLGFAIVATLPQAFRHPTNGPVGLHIMYRIL
jgi:GNAT superfamily N-acetyltransferase